MKVFELPGPALLRFQEFLFVIGLLFSLAPIESLWGWGAFLSGWTLLASLCFKERKYILFSFFFFSTFFHPICHYRSITFSLKHFHLVTLLALITETSKGTPLKVWFQNHKLQKIFLPLYSIIILSLLSVALHSNSPKAYYISFNFLAVLLSFAFLTSLLLDQPHILLKRVLFYFVMGVGIQIVIAAYNMFYDSHFLSLSLYQNRHIGLLASFALFYGLSLAIMEEQTVKRLGLWLILSVIALGFLYTCSRMAMHCNLLFFALFCILAWRYAPTSEAKRLYFNRLTNLLVLLSFLASFAMIVNIYIWARIRELPEILMGGHWSQSFQDHQNFGLFGYLRIEQFFELLEIFKRSPWIGIGFTNQVISFHGLYLTLLGAGGIVGLLLFVWFGVQLMARIYPCINNKRSSPETFLMGLANLCALHIWFVNSLTESMFLQFYIWINVIVAFVFIQASGKFFAATH